MPEEDDHRRELRGEAEVRERRADAVHRFPEREAHGFAAVAGDVVEAEPHGREFRRRPRRERGLDAVAEAQRGARGHDASHGAHGGDRPEQERQAGAAGERARGRTRRPHPGQPQIAQVLAHGMPAERRVDRLFVHFVARRHDDRAVGGGLAVVEALVVDGHAEEAGGPVGDEAGMLLFDRAPDRLFALVDAEDELRAWTAVGQRRRQRAAHRHRIEHGTAIRAFVGLLENAPARQVRTRGALVPETCQRGVVERRHGVGRERRGLREMPETRGREGRGLRSRSRHAGGERRPGEWQTGGAADAGERMVLEQQPHGEEILERGRRTTRMIGRMAFEPREHAGPARERERRRAEPRLDGVAGDAEGVERGRDHLTRAAAVGGHASHVQLDAAAGARRRGAGRVQRGDRRQETAFAARQRHGRLSVIEEAGAESHEFAMHGHVGVVGAERHEHVAMAAWRGCRRGGHGGTA